MTGRPLLFNIGWNCPPYYEKEKDNMEIEFLYESDIEDMIGIVFNYEEDLIDVKGLSIGVLNKTMINLSAIQWKDFSEKRLITEISKTILHEICHVEISGNAVGFTPDGEETVCQLFADQI